jgi:hypothetical protein
MTGEKSYCASWNLKKIWRAFKELEMKTNDGSKSGSKDQWNFI